MAFYGRNKNEMLVLTAAVYSFVAYLTAFTLEILFIIDFAKQNNALLPILGASSAPQIAEASASASSMVGASLASSYDDSSANLEDSEGGSGGGGAFDQARLALESMQAHITVSCLAVSILYFVIFVASLILITALILRSTFFILIWMCTMTTLYLPEFGLVIYVSIYGWGLSTRNGQCELVFYLIRSVLNVIFISRAHKLFKEWNYEKNFFRLKTNHRFTGYDSPYFVGDSLTTTINPVFSTSTLNLADRFDRVRDSTNSYSNNNNDGQHNHHHQQHHHNQQQQQQQFSPSAFGKVSSRGQQHLAKYGDVDIGSPNRGHHRPAYGSYDLDSSACPSSATTATAATKFYLSANNRQQQQQPNGQKQQQQQLDYSKIRSTGFQYMRPGSNLSFNDAMDNFPDYEMDLEYRTLTSQRNYLGCPNELARNGSSGRQQVARLGASNADQSAGFNAHAHANNITQTTSHHHPHQQQQLQLPVGRSLQDSPGSLSYSTQSLDRRHLKDMDFVLREQVILRPLGHQPFEYLHRPGSTSQLNSMNSLNTQTSACLSNTKLTKRSEFNLQDHYRYS